MKIREWIDDTVHDVYFERQGDIRGLFARMVLCLPLLLVWFILKKI